MTITIQDAAVAAAMEATGLTEDELDSVTAKVSVGQFRRFFETDPEYSPTVRVDLCGEAAAVFAAAFNAGAKALGQNRRAWCPTYSDADADLLEKHGVPARQCCAA